MKKPEHKKAIEDRSFDIKTEADNSDLIEHVEKSTSYYNLARTSNLNPLLAMRIEKRIIMLNTMPGKAFADVELDCEVHLFKWDDIPDTNDEKYEKEEIANFLGQCKVHEGNIINAIKELGLPI